MAFYLEDLPLAEANKRFEAGLKRNQLHQVFPGEEISLDENALGRVTAEPIWARLSSPHYHASAMDGFALRAADTEGASQTRPVRLEAGTESRYIDTGDPLPPWADAVIPIENTEPLDGENQPAQNPRSPKQIRIREAVPPWANVRPMGEDMVATQLVLPAGHVLRPVDLGAIAGCGHDSVRVVQPPKVAVIPTGTELVSVGEPVGTGEILEYNSIVMAAQIKEWGGVPTRFPITPDEYDLLKERVSAAAQDHDLVLINAGSSAGSEDYTAQIVDELGEVLVHGIAVRPGHPVILGFLEGENKATAVIGVPGYPVSTALTGEIFVEPLMARWLGRTPKKPLEIEAELTRKTTSPPGDDDYVRVAVGKVGERTLAAPLSRGSGVITSLVRADGIMVIPRGSQGYPAGENVTVQLYRAPHEIQNTLFAVGSHDITLDILAQFLTQEGRRLVSANVGSLGGLLALRREEAHLAGAHLLDPETGEYNLSYIREYLPDQAVQVLALVGRTQGLFVQKGNPKAIQNLEDLTRADVRYVNRQRGAGTRLLLDYHLGEKGIRAEDIQGYDQEEYTHLASAVAVASGRADCALGIEAAAYALDLDFLPLYSERYDLIVPEEFVGSDLLAPLYEVLHDPAFQKAVSERPGYDVTPMGTVVAEIRP